VVKWLGLVGGYGHLQYRPLHWQPIPADRAVFVDVERVDGAPPPRRRAKKERRSNHG
jgi:hypothetical protein